MAPNSDAGVAGRGLPSPRGLKLERESDWDEGAWAARIGGERGSNDGGRLVGASELQADVTMVFGVPAAGLASSVSTMNSTGSIISDGDESPLRTTLLSSNSSSSSFLTSQHVPSTQEPEKVKIIREAIRNEDKYVERAGLCWPMSPSS